MVAKRMVIHVHHSREMRWDGQFNWWAYPHPFNQGRSQENLKLSKFFLFQNNLFPAFFCLDRVSFPQRTIFQGMKTHLAHISSSPNKRVAIIRSGAGAIVCSELAETFTLSLLFHGSSRTVDFFEMLGAGPWPLGWSKKVGSHWIEKEIFECMHDWWTFCRQAKGEADHVLLAWANTSDTIKDQ